MPTFKLNKLGGINNKFRKFKPFLEYKKNSMYLTAILSLFSLSFFGVFAIRPTLTTAVSLSKEIDDLRQLNIQYENKITSIVKAQSEYENIRDSIPLFYASLPESSQFTTLIINLEKIAAESNMTLNGLNIDPQFISVTDEKGKMKLFNINLSLSGDYKSTYTFLSHLLKTQRLISVLSMNLDQNQATTGGLLNINIRAQSYYEQ